MLVTRKLNWGQDRVTYYDASGKLVSMPATWTNLGEVDRYVLQGGIRTHFRIEDLIELAVMLKTFSDERRSV